MQTIKIPTADQIERLSGYKAETLRKFVAFTGMIGSTGVRYFADGFGAGAATPPIDVSRYKRRFITIENNHDATFRYKLFFYDELDRGTGNTDARFAESSADFVDVEPGEKIIIDTDNRPELDVPSVGLAIQAVCAATTGSVTVRFLGGTR